MLAASPSFLQTTCEGVHSVSGRLAPNLPVGLTCPPPYHPAKEPHVLRATELGERAEATGRRKLSGAQTWPLPTAKVMFDPKQAPPRRDLIPEDVQWGPKTRETT